MKKETELEKLAEQYKEVAEAAKKKILFRLSTNHSVSERRYDHEFSKIEESIEKEVSDDKKKMHLKKLSDDLKNSFT